MSDNGQAVRAHRRFNRWVLVGVYGVFGCVMALNAIIDPYRVFHWVEWGSGYTDNERYNKVAHLIAHVARHDAFIVGSSRMGLYDPNDLNQLRSGRDYYNLATFGGSAQDALLMLRAIQSHGVAIREVVFGIDLFPFLEPPGEVTPAYRHHPEASGQSYSAFFTSYLLSPSVTHAFLKLQHTRMAEPDLEFDFEGNGRFYLRRWDREIAADPEAYAATAFKASHQPPRARQALWNTARFDELHALVAWAEQSGVALYVFVQPHHHSELKRYTPETLTVFHRKVRAVTGDLPDFTRHADWSRNNDWYYEPKHYRPELAREVVRALFMDPSALTEHASVSMDTNSP